MKIVSANITGSLTLNNVDITTTVQSSSIWSGSFSTRVTSLELFSSSLDATFATDAQLTSLSQSFSSSISILSGSLQQRITNTETTSSNLTTASGSFSTRVANNEVTSSNLTTASGSFSTRVSDTETTASSLVNASSSFSTRVSTNETNISNLQTASGSFSTRVTSLETASGSFSTRVSTNETNITNLQNASSSFSTRVTSAESSITSIQGVTGSYATTGSNNFVGVQYISNTSNAISFTSTSSLYTDGGLRIAKDMYVSGTAYFKNITVFGTQSISYISSSQLNISTNLISVNTDTPLVRFGGLAVYDSGSTQLSGSLLWDSEANHWVYSNPSGSSYSGGMLISGPRASSLGTEQGTTNNALMKGQGGDHITSSGVFEVSGSVGIGTTNPGFKLDINGNARILGGSTYLGEANVASGHLNAYELMTFNIDVDNDDSNRYFAWYTNAADGAGTELMRLTEAGNVGIGTTSPTGKLDVSPGGTVTAGDLVVDTANKTVYVGRASGTDNDNSVFIVRDRVGTTKFYVAGGSGTNSYFAAGNVGIGTTSPSTTLHVRTDTGVLIKGASSTTDAILSLIPASGGRQYDFRNYGSSFGIKDNSADFIRMYFHYDGNVGIGDSGPSSRLHVYTNGTGSSYNGIGMDNGAQEHYWYLENNTTSVYSIGSTAGQWKWINSNGTHVTIASGGNVGIGTTSMDTKLHVYNGSAGTISSYESTGITIENSGRASLQFLSPVANDAYVFFGSPNAANAGYVGYENTANRLVVRSAGYVSLLDSTGEIIRITGGNVGIGTTSPAGKFEIKSAAQNYTTAPAITFTDNTGVSDSRWILGNIATTYGAFNLAEAANASSTSYTPRITILPGGNVGIGTTSPSRPFTIYTGAPTGATTANASTALLIDSNANQYIELRTASTSSGLMQGMLFTDNGQNAFIGFKEYTNAVAGTYGEAIHLAVYDYSNSDPNNGIYFGTSTTPSTGVSTVHMFIKGNGNVGIGTTSPLGKLHVQGSEAYIRVTDSDDSGVFFLGNTGGYSYIRPFSRDFRVINAAGSSLFAVTSGGNVGIGTTNPTQNLQVNGGVYLASSTLGNTARVGIGTTSFSGANPKFGVKNDYADYTVQFEASTTTGASYGLRVLGGTNSSDVSFVVANAANTLTYFTIRGDGNVVPGANGTYDLGTSSLRWSTVYTSDLDMSNGIGDYTIVEGEEDLFLYNNKTDKVFKFLIQEVDPSIAPPKKIK